MTAEPKKAVKLQKDTKRYLVSLCQFLLAILVVSGIPLVINALFASSIQFGFFATKTFSLSDYDMAVLTNNSTPHNDMYAYLGREVSVGTQYDASSSTLSGLLKAVVVKELPTSEYTTLSQINPQTVQNGEYARLQAGEAAISSLLAEKRNLAVGESILLLERRAPNSVFVESVKIKYIYHEAYSLFQIEGNWDVGSVLLNSESEIRAEKEQYLRYVLGDSGDAVTAAYAKKDEVQAIGTDHILNLVLSFVLTAVVLSAALLFFNRKSYKRYYHARGLGASGARAFGAAFGKAAVQLLLATAISVVVFATRFQVPTIHLVVIGLQLLCPTVTLLLHLFSKGGKVKWSQ